MDLVTLLALMSILHQISLAREKLASDLIQIALGCYRQVVCFFASLAYQLESIRAINVVYKLALRLALFAPSRERNVEVGS